MSQQLLGSGSAAGLPPPAPAQQSPAAPPLLQPEHRLVLDRRTEVVRHHGVEHVLPLPGVRLLSGDQLPQSDPEGEDVGMRRDPLAFQQLRGSVRVRATDMAQVGADSSHLTAALKLQRTAEISDFTDVLTWQQQVGRFDVQMHDTVGVKEP